tara:strand:+ start:5243 stop:6448 length:1206 start_codon:yes stop_codon:yes gene_type:complete
MLNKDFDVLKNWMFGSLNSLLGDISPNPNFNVLKMSIGEPQLGPPKFIRAQFDNFFDYWGKYPPSEPIPILQDAIRVYLNQRFPGSEKIINFDKNLAPVPGTREALHLVGLISKNAQKNNSIAALTNPFYHAWKAGAIESDSKILWLNAKESNNYNPNIDDLSKETLKSISIMYLCFPTNPHGALTNIDYFIKVIKLAKEYDFILAIDECYIDIYRTSHPKPIGCLDALVKMNVNLDNIVIFNSLSKRSNVPGLRAGFIVGDEKVISLYKLLVSNGASPVPIPIQNIAASLYKDEKHNYETCLYYDQNFKIAKECLEETHPNLKIPDAGFYLWLPVKDDLKATIDLWRDYSVRVMPGTFMAENVSGENPCKGFLRIALVHKKEIVTEAMQRISNYFKNNYV